MFPFRKFSLFTITVQVFLVLVSVQIESNLIKNGKSHLIQPEYGSI
jgi:hypothetical protein